MLRKERGPEMGQWGVLSVTLTFILDVTKVGPIRCGGSTCRYKTHVRRYGGPKVQYRP